jgi:tetratricopeptide (TPR) repeat protein
VVPRQLPPPPVHFANRTRELSVLDAKTRGRNRTPAILVLKGPGGVGKSALALRWLDSARDRFPDGQLHAKLTLPTGEPVAIEDVLGGFLRALGVAPERVPPGLAERVTLFRSVSAGRALALLLDDAVSAAQVKALLPASPAGVVLVTSRHPLAGLLTDGAEVLPVEPLDDGSAVDLLARHVGADRLAADRSSVEALVRLCAGLPIALCVAAAQLVLRPHRPVAKLVTDLRDDRKRLDVLTMDDDLSVRATLDLSVRALSPDAAAAYVSIGVHPGRLVCTELIVATTRAGLGRARHALDELVDASLLQEIDDEVYLCHDLVHAHARAEVEHRADATTRERLLRTILEWHLYVAREAGAAVLPSRRVLPFEPAAGTRYELPPASTRSLDWLDRHRQDLAALVGLAVDRDLPELAYALGDAMQPLFIVHRHHREAVEVDELALRAAVAMADLAAQHGMRRRLARVLVDLGELARARPHIDEVLERTERSGDRRGRASGLKLFARLQSRQGRRDEAVTSLRESVAILRDLGRRRSTGLALIELGETLLDAGRPAEAASPLAEARTILLAMHPPDPFNAARATIPLARAYNRLDDHAAASRLLDDAAETLAAFGSDHQLGRVHEAFADLYDATDDPGRAWEHRTRADQLLGRPARPDPDVE